MRVENSLRQVWWGGLMLLVLICCKLPLSAQQATRTLGPIEREVITWCALPEAERANGLARFPKDPPNRRVYIQGALALYLAPPANTVKTESYLDLVINLANGTDLITFDLVKDVLNSADRQIGVGAVGGQGYPSVTQATKHAAVRMLRVITAWQPDSLPVQMKAARMLEDCDERDAALASLTSALTSVPEPERRTVRLELLNIRRAWGRTVPPSPAEQQDPLFIADSQVVAKDFANAKTHYFEVIRDTHAPLERCLSAWAGLLDTTPADALAMGPKILANAEKRTEPQRGRLVVWFGRELWRVVFREEASTTDRWTIPGVSIQTATGWRTSLASLMEKTIALAPGACLRPDSQQFPPSLQRQFPNTARNKGNSAVDPSVPPLIPWGNATIHASAGYQYNKAVAYSRGAGSGAGNTY